MEYLLLYLIILSAFVFFRNSKLNHRVLFLLLILLWLFTGFRDAVGYDWDSYVYYYNTSSPLADLISNPGKANNRHLEYGFLLLTAILAPFKFHFLLFIVISFLTIMITWRAIQKLSPDLWISLLAYVYLSYFNNFAFIRQGLSIAIFVYAIRYVVNREFVKYLLLVIAASLFHYTAIMLLPFYFLLHLKFRNITIIALLMLAVLVQYSHLMAPLIQQVVDLSSAYYSDRYNVYVANILKSEPTGLSLLFIEWAFTISFFMIMRRNGGRLFEPDLEERYNVLFNAAWMGLFLYLLLGEIPVTVRFIFYFRGTMILLYPFAWLLISGINEKRIAYMVLFLFIYYSGVVSLNKVYPEYGESRFLPYRSMLMK